MEKNMDKTAAAPNGNSGQTFPAVMIVAGVLAILSTTLLFVFQTETKNMVKVGCMQQKQELASLALEHAIFKLQQGSNWDSLPLTNFNGYDKEFSSSLGKYSLHVADGNLFMTTLTNPTTRQAKKEYKTIGIKVKSKILNCTGMYYAVVQRKVLGGPLVSKGKIDLPCTDAKLEDSNFFWGDIFSANTNTGHCRIASIDVARGAARQQWLPKVYAKSDIYTVLGYTGGRTGSYIFGYTYDDMSPTAHSHPYSEYATAPDIDFDYFRMMAKQNDAYYGPPNVPGIGPNPFYINDGKHDISFVTQANAVTIMAKLRSPASVLFIDTTDGLPVRWSPSPTNTYAGSVSVTANLATDKTLRFYVNHTNQYMTNGLCFVMGPLMLIGNEPASIANTYGYTWGYKFTSGNDADNVFDVKCPDNYYFPQQNDGYHYIRNTTDETQSRLYNVKHSGLLFVDGELRIGGPRSGSTTYSNICIYGTILLGEKGVLKVDTTNDNPLLYVYYNRNLNVFGLQGSSVALVSFNSISYLVPTPAPVYPY